MNPDQSSESSDTTTAVNQTIDIHCCLCSEHLITAQNVTWMEQPGVLCGRCEHYLDFMIQRLSNYAHALERNGVAIGTIRALREKYLEECDLRSPRDPKESESVKIFADLPAKQSQAMIRAAAKTGHSGDNGEGAGRGVR